jgi:hypothetical protein
LQDFAINPSFHFKKVKLHILYRTSQLTFIDCLWFSGQKHLRSIGCHCILNSQHSYQIFKVHIEQSAFKWLAKFKLYVEVTNSLGTDYIIAETRCVIPRLLSGTIQDGTTNWYNSQANAPKHFPFIIWGPPTAITSLT